MITHHDFTLERVYPKDPPTRVFLAFTDPRARARWFIGGDGWTVHDIRRPVVVEPGAVEASRFSPKGSPVVITNDTTWFEVEPGERAIFAYYMTIDGKPLSSSLATVEFRAEGPGTRLIFTEQGAYHDGYADNRAEGTRLLLDALGRELAAGEMATF